MKYWIAYLAGSLLTDAGALMRYVRQRKKAGVPTKTAAAEYFVERSMENGVEWATTVGVVWAGGVIYIERVGPFLFGALLGQIALHPAFAFLLGGVLTLSVPAIFRILTSKIAQ